MVTFNLLTCGFIFDCRFWSFGGGIEVVPSHCNFLCFSYLGRKERDIHLYFPVFLERALVSIHALLISILLARLCEA